MIGAGGFVDPTLADGDVYAPASLGSAPKFSGVFTEGSAASVKIDLLNAAGAVIGGVTENVTPYDYTYGGPALAEGAYTLRATAYAGAGATGASVATQEFDFVVDDGVIDPPPPPPPSDGTIIVAIAASGGDAESFGGIASTDLEFGINSGKSNSVGLRFTGIDLDATMEIESAYFIFEAEGSNADAANLKIEIQDSTSAVNYPNANSINARSYLPQSVAWSNVAPWEAGKTYQSADVTTLLEALIGADGLEATDAIAFRITGTGTRQAFSFDDAAGDAPELVINYFDTLIG